MSLFDALVAELECLATRKKEKQLIQIFFRDCYRDKTYHIGSTLDNLPPEYNNTWIRTDYVCESCSPKTKGKIRDFVKTEDQRRHIGMQKFITKLKRLPRFEVKLGRLQLIGNKFKQKMVDILMSLDIVDMCFDEQIQQAILIAGDSDFIPAIKKAKNYGAIIHLYYHPSSVHNEILDEIDELHEITEELINSCKK